MVNIAILGAGFMGGTHARALAKLPDVNIVGISSRSLDEAASLAQEVGAAPYDDAMSLLHAPGVEAVSITLPTFLHPEYTLAALAAGKHVLVEKPMALTVGECDAMIETAQRVERILMVGHVLRFWPEYQALVELVHSGELGRPLTATAARLCPPPSWSPWFQDPALSGGEVLDLHIHDLDVLNWLFGEPQRLTSLGQRSPHGTWDVILTNVEYEGVVCHAEGNAMMPESFPFTMLLRVLCERGTVEYSVRASGAQVDSAGGGVNSLLVYRDNAPPQALPSASGDAYEIELAAFVEAVRCGTRPTQGTPEQGRLAVQTALAARASMESERPVSF
jgi:predicted dehydrogenase